MPNLTPQEIRRLKKIADALDKGNVAVLEHLFELEEDYEKKIAELKAEIARKMPDLEVVLKSVRGKQGEQGIQGEKGAKGDRGEKGDKGDQGERGIPGRDGVDGRDGFNGKDGEKGEKGDKGDQGEPGSLKELAPQEVRDLLELLQGDERLSLDAIRGLSDALTALRERPVGGVTDKAVQFALMRSIQAVTPSGTIDGVNATFIVPSTIHAVLSFELNSRVVALGEYTITGSARKTIVFDSAPSANYAGKSFVITYI